MGQSPDGDTIIENTEKGIEFHQGKIFFTDTYISRSNKNTINPKKKAPKQSILMCVRAPVGNVNITDREIPSISNILILHVIIIPFEEL